MTAKETLPRMRLGLCAMIHNCREEYFVEWMEHHRALGFDDFFLYDNESAPPLGDSVDKLPFREAVTVFPAPGWSKELQMECYLDCCERIKSGTLPDCGRVAFLDDDEFIQCYEDLAGLLGRYRDHPGLALSWKVYGTSGHLTRPAGSQVANYRHGSGEDFGMNQHVKTIADPRQVTGFHDTHSARYAAGHCVDVRRRPVSGAFTPPTHAVAWVAHYFTRSREEFFAKMEARNSRGRDAGPIQAEWLDQIEAHCHPC